EVTGIRGREELVGLLRIDTDQHPALATRRNGHVAADEEREPTEHLLLAHARLARDQLPYAVRKILVVRHRRQSYGRAQRDGARGGRRRGRSPGRQAPPGARGGWVGSG